LSDDEAVNEESDSLTEEMLSIAGEMLRRADAIDDPFISRWLIEMADETHACPLWD
jgi:hypothetical protein